jgi:ribose transport system permease protein
VLVLVGFSLASRHFLTYSNALNVLSNITVIGIVSLGQAFTIISGGFNLSVSGTLPLGAVSFTLAVNAGMPIS